MESGGIVELQLVSGASNKELCLSSQVEAFRQAGVIARLGLADLIVSRLVAPREVYEPNTEVKAAPALYVAKARHAKALTSDLDKKDDTVRLAADTHPKAGIPGKQLNVVITKYPKPLELTSLNDRLEGLSRFIYSNFGQFGRSESVLMRAGLGVVPWLDSLIGLVDAKSYVLYGRNPLPDVVAAKDFLQMCAETHVDNDGTLNNRQLQRSLMIAGATPQEDLIRFAVENNIPVEVRGRSNSPLEEIDMIGDGFTPEVLLTMLQMILGKEYTETNKPSTKTYYGGRRVSLLPNSRHRIIWSAQDNRLASEYVGSYTVS